MFTKATPCLIYSSCFNCSWFSSWAIYVEVIKVDCGQICIICIHIRCQHFLTNCVIHESSKEIKAIRRILLFIYFHFKLI